MTWLLPRIVAGLIALLLGAALGYALGGRIEAPFISAFSGAAVAVALAAVFDTLRGARLIGWLRGAQQSPAPRDAGLWGEMAYRVERALRQREKAISLHESRLRQFMSAIEASPNGILLLDAKRQIEWCNPVAADHFGLDPQRDRGQPVTNLVRAPAFVGLLQAPDFEHAIVFANPRRVGTLMVQLRPYGDNALLVLSQDITESERNEAMRRDFVANVSHEIRTPLTVLAGFVETMGTLPLTPVERKRVLDLMRQQTDRMQALVADLLTLAQLEGSPWPAADRWVVLGPILAKVEADARALSAGRHAIHVDPGPELKLAAAASELQSAISNVVNNAVRYTPEGGTIELSASLRPDGACVIHVRDTGLGIAAEHIPRLTERFYRVDCSRSRDTGGTGLGLSIVKHVLQRHGGELEVASTPGQGSTFSLVLPAARVRGAGSP